MSREPTPGLPEDLEKELQEYYTSPEPSPEFVARLEGKLHSQSGAQEQRKMSGRSRMKLAWGLGLVIAAVVIGLLATSPTIVMAMKRLLGYIPGFGLVDSTSPLRVLAEPVSMTRDGVTVTVREAVLSSEKTVIVFSVENIPFDKLVHREDQAGCRMTAELRLPDGTALQMTGGEGEGWGTGYENRFDFRPVPAEVKSAILLVPCIQGVLPGGLPEHWELPLSFVPAPPDMQLRPVVELTPSPEAAGRDPLVLEKVIETDTGYILIGRLYSLGLPAGAQALHLNEWPEITDASGQTVPFSEPVEFVEHAWHGGEVPWAYEIEGKQFDWPLVLSFEGLAVELANARTEFHFDTGPTPYSGQVWELNLDLEMAAYPLRIISATRTDAGYAFEIQTDPTVMSVRLEMPGMAASGGEGEGNGHFHMDVTYDREIPSGDLTVLLDRPRVALDGRWQIEWQPGDSPASQTGTPAPAPLSITRTIDTGDSYILIGEFRPPQQGGSEAGSPQPGGLLITDGNNREVFWDFPQDIDLPATDWPDVQPWAVKIAKGFAAPLHITYLIQYIHTDPTHARYELEFDAGPDPQPGQSWELNQEIQLAGYTFTLNSISVTPPMRGSKPDGYKFSFLSPDGKLSGVSVAIEGYTALGAGGGGGPEVSQAWSVGLAYAELPAGQLKVVISDLSRYGEKEEWTIDWQPENPADPASLAPAETAQACLTSDTWQAALIGLAQIPPDLTGKLVAYGRIVEDGLDPSPDNYGIYVTSLDGSEKRVIGQGVWASLSPDGSHVAYAWRDGLYLADAVTGESQLIPNTNSNDYNPQWSPDGTRLAFMRIDDFNLYAVDPAGTGLQRIIDGIDYEQLVGWSPDGGSLFYGINTQAGMLLRRLELASGESSDLFTVDNKALYADISPDGSQIAFLDKFNEMTSGIYVASLDGSHRQLVAQMDHWLVVNPVWSPDGKWLLVGIVDTDMPRPREATALINLQTCQIVPLPITGTFYTWVP